MQVIKFAHAVLLVYPVDFINASLYVPEALLSACSSDSEVADDFIKGKNLSAVDIDMSREVKIIVNIIQRVRVLEQNIS